MIHFTTCILQKSLIPMNYRQSVGLERQSITTRHVNVSQNQILICNHCKIFNAFINYKKIKL